jgi:hypothetical protein
MKKCFRTTKINLLKDANVLRGSVGSHNLQNKLKTSHPLRKILRPETALRPRKISKNFSGILPVKLHPKNINTPVIAKDKPPRQRDTKGAPPLCRIAMTRDPFKF